MSVKLRNAYNMQKRRAKARGIEWNFTPSEWFAVWQRSGRLDQRGKGKGKYVMSRLGDVGPYCPSNVRIVLYEHNVIEARTLGRKSTYELCRRQIGSGRGWTMFRGMYQVSVSKQYVGRFANQVDAEAAYHNAAAARLAKAAAMATAAMADEQTVRRLTWDE